MPQRRKSFRERMLEPQNRRSIHVEDRRNAPPLPHPPVVFREEAQRLEDIVTGRSPYEDYTFDEGTDLKVPVQPMRVDRFLNNVRNRKPGVAYPMPR